MTPQIEIQLIAALVALACALLGVFLVLRQMALMSDAISHSILLGIVVGYFVTREIDHPLVILGATLSGVFTVWLVEMLLRTRLVKEDAAIGLIFPVLFSVGVLLISRYAGNIHLDVDAVLLGELAFAPFNRGEFLGLDLPRGVWIMGTILLLNLAGILFFYKELKLATFDPELAAALGFAPALLHYGLMTLVSVTAVGAFDHVGAVLVVALMIAPPAAAYLLTDSLARMLLLSGLIGVLSAISGYWLARFLDSNIAGAMATMTGVFFLLTLIFAPERGLLARAWQRKQRRQRFAVEMLLVHLSRHEGTPSEASENRTAHLTGEMNWEEKLAEATVRRARQQALISGGDERLQLTQYGREVVREVMQR
jgi:manganese/zinc/iron transport system permease protein